jgi:putative transposase
MLRQHLTRWGRHREEPPDREPSRLPRRAEVATVARPDTHLGWYGKLVARKFDGSKARRGPGRPRVKLEVEQLIVRMASENRGMGL